MVRLQSALGYMHNAFSRIWFNSDYECAVLENGIYDIATKEGIDFLRLLQIR